MEAGSLRIALAEGDMLFSPLRGRRAECHCPVCGDFLASRPHRPCPRCGVPHHEDCWTWAGGCAVFACGARARRPLLRKRPETADGRPFRRSRPSFATVSPSPWNRAGSWALAALAVTALGLGVFAISYWAAPVLAPLGMGATFVHEMSDRLRRRGARKAS